jgi:trimethylamine--corrinoid protein Co-methyltransferase
MRPTIRVLSDDLIERILDEAMRVLAETGMEIRGAEMRRRLLEAGLPTNAAGDRILFPRAVMEKAIADAPRSFLLYDRDGNPHADLGGDRVHFVPGSSGLKWLDHRTGEVRLADSADFVAYVRLADGLEHIAYLATAFSTNADIEPQVSDAWRLSMALANSRKPVVSGAFTEHGVPRMVELMQLFRRDGADLRSRPMSIFTITATGNFRYSEDSCQNLLDCVEAGIPVEIVPVTLMGLTAPVTTLGAAAFHVAEVLAGLTMAQVIRPGSPVLLGAAPAAFHMRAASSVMAAMDAMRLSVISAQMAARLGVPSQAYLAFSDGPVLDAQAGAETAAGAVLAVLAGVDCVAGPGMLDLLRTFSLPKLVLDDELAGEALRLGRDIQPMGDLPTTGFVAELLDEGQLASAPHTLEHWPRELPLAGPVIDRTGREAWLAGGARDAAARARDEVERLLAAWEPPPTDPRLDEEARLILAAGRPEGRPLPDWSPVRS